MMKDEGKVTGRLVIFTDLDGTLLSDSYSFQEALPALALIKQYNIPLVLCSSKTKPEIEFYQKNLNNQDPFISENGGGIFVPHDYFGPNVSIPEHHHTPGKSYVVIALGAHYADLRKTFKELQEEGFLIKGFGDMTAAEISLATGLTHEEAKMAKQRDFDEPFFYGGREEEMASLFSSIRSKGFHVTKGRVYHLLGNSDKGKAVSILIDLFRQKFGTISSVAIGDSPNDIPMLEKVDIPIIVQRPDGTYDEMIRTPKTIKSPGIGPVGWNNAIISLLEKFREQNL